MGRLRSDEWYAGDDRNAHLNEVASAVERGVYEAGGTPLNLPVVSLGETQVRPTAMLWRNMAAMAMEEMFRANPIDGLVLLGGCAKTIPALLMAAASVDLPAVVVPGGPMLNGHFRGTPLGCGTDVWKLSEEVRAGRLSQDTFVRSESSMIRSRVLTRGSFLNAIVALAAVGGSTNAVVHLLAIAGRLGVELTLDDFDRVGADVPLLVNLQPAGRDLIEDLFRAGGPLAVLEQVKDLLDPSAITVTGRPLVDHLADNPVWDSDVIAPRTAPLVESAGIAVLRGNVAPDG